MNFSKQSSQSTFVIPKAQLSENQIFSLEKRYGQTGYLDFGAQGSLHLDIRMNTSDVPLQMRNMEHLRTEGAMPAHIIMNFFDVSCQVFERFLSHSEGTFP